MRPTAAEAGLFITSIDKELLDRGEKYTTNHASDVQQSERGGFMNSVLCDSYSN